LFAARCSPEDLPELERIACAIRDPLSNLCFPDPQIDLPPSFDDPKLVSAVNRMTRE
jgi:hypothetical protein